MRVVNSLAFRLPEYSRFESYDRLVQELYGKWL